jgi:hypothetical protein
VWNFPDGRIIEFGHCQYEDDVFARQSAAYDGLFFDELTHFTRRQYVYLVGSRVRTTIGTNQRCRVVSATNPGGVGNDWVMERWAPWLDQGHANPAKPGELRWFYMDGNDNDIPCSPSHPKAQSRTYIPAPRAGNKYLAEGYEDRLNLLPEPWRSQLRDGDWAAGLTDDPLQVIPRQWVVDAQARWVREAPKGVPVVGVDPAYGGADQTVLCPRRGMHVGPLLKLPGVQTDSGEKTATIMANTMPRGTAFNVDVIGWGAATVEAAQRMKMRVQPISFARKSHARDRSGMLSFQNLRAECYYALRWALDPESGMNLALPPDAQLMGDLCAVRRKPRAGTVIVLEEKDEIKKRLGRSPDCGDALALTFAPVQRAAVLPPSPAQERRVV